MGKYTDMDFMYEKLILDIAFYFTETLMVLGAIACLGMVVYSFFDKSGKIAK